MKNVMQSGVVTEKNIKFSENERCELLARYLLEEKATVRRAAGVFGISKSTVHKDVTTVLKKQKPQLYNEVKLLLEKNKQERHFRGGEATRRKYSLIRQEKDG